MSDTPETAPRSCGAKRDIIDELLKVHDTVPCSFDLMMILVQAAAEIGQLRKRRDDLLRANTEMTQRNQHLYAENVKLEDRRMKAEDENYDLECRVGCLEAALDEALEPISKEARADFLAYHGLLPDLDEDGEPEPEDDGDLLNPETPTEGGTH